MGYAKRKLMLFDKIIRYGRSSRKSPSKGVPERQRGRGMLVRLLGKLWVNPLNIPLRRFAFAARRGPPSKGEVGLAKAIGAGVVFSDIPLRRFTFEGGMADLGALPD